jgi:hypothetical protein
MQAAALGLILSLAVAAIVGANAALTGERLYIAHVIDHPSARDDRLRPARLVRAIKRIDLDHDGVPDYLVDYNQVINSHWCGDGGCNFELWHGTKNGHPVRVWNQIVRSYQIAQRNGETVFDFDFHGSNCGTFGASACPASFAWDPKAARMVERPTRHGETTVRLIDPIPVTRTDVPATILAASRAAHTRCKARGMRDEASLPASIPDIDGDGMRDWSLTIAVCNQPRQSDLQQVLFASAGNARRPVVAASGAFYVVSVATIPASVARINQTRMCGGLSVDAKLCPTTALRWDAATKTLATAKKSTG